MNGSESKPEFPTPAWRPAKPTDQADVEATPPWRREPAHLTTQEGGSRRGGKLLAVVALAGVFLGLLVWVSAWLRPPTSALFIAIGAGYEKNLLAPLNTAGVRALNAIASQAQNRWSNSSRHLGMLRPLNSSTLTTDVPWDAPLEGVASRAVILYFCVHGAVDADGPYLMPNDLDASSPLEDRLRLTAILDRLEKLPPAMDKLLVLDVTHFVANWNLGVLSNSIARSLIDFDERIRKISNLVVVTACGPDQHSWIDDSWSQTTFGRSMLEGLQGKGDLNNDDRINALELYDFVKSRVEGWTWQNRLALQTPMLLPAGDEGRVRAKRIHVTMRPLTSVVESAPPTKDRLPDAWRSAWESYRRLSEQSPPPAAYSPQLWRRYQEILIRYEELLLDGELQTAPELLLSLNQIEQEISQQGALTLDSLENTLTMPAAAGIVQPLPTSIASRWAELWAADQSARFKIWNAVRPMGVPTVAQRLERLAYYQMLLKQTILYPAELSKALDVAQLLRSPSTPTPAEAHLLRMIARDAATPRPPNELISLALNVRVLAEQAALGVQDQTYPYSEQVLPWTRALIQQSDDARRRGENLLFASNPESWAASKAAFLEAQTGYQKAMQQAGLVQGAVRIRDRVLSMLPFYSRWAALGQPARDPRATAKADQMVASIQRLWNSTHLLAELLSPQERAPGGAQHQEDLAKLADLSADVAASFGELEQGFASKWQNVDSVALPDLIRSLDAALRVPYADPNWRIRLIERRRQISQQWARAGLDGSRDVPMLTEQENQKRAIEAGRRQGSLALASLGRQWFNTVSGPSTETYEQVKFRLESFQTEAKWWNSLNAAGSQIGTRFQRLPARINLETARASDLALVGADEALAETDRLSRLLPAAFNDLVKVNASMEYRRWLVRSLLVEQSRRTFADHWFAYDPDETPYFRFAGMVFNSDAARFSMGESSMEEIRSIQRALAAPATLVAAGPSQTTVTSQLRFGIPYAVAPSPGATIPAGDAVVWIESDNTIDLIEPKSNRRLIRPVGGKQKTTTLACEASSPLISQAETDPAKASFDPVQANFTFRGLYRGQILALATDVQIIPVADRIDRKFPPPSVSGLAVRTTPSVQQKFGASRAAIAIVLDCSGSMGPVNQFEPTTKYAEATQALRTVLSRVPKGVSVSIWVFGQAIEPTKTVPAEQTVQRVQEPIVWDPSDPEQLNLVMSRVEYPVLEPWNESPVVRAMTSAKADLEGVAGFRTLLVLTDGMDNRFATDRQLNPTGMDVAGFLVSQFQNTGIEVNVVGFKVATQEQEHAKRQFQVVESFSVPGKWYNVSQATDLVRTLDLAMFQKLRYWVEREDGVLALGCPETGLEASQLGGGNLWYPGGLSPGAYRIRLRTDQLVRREFVVERGDLLLVDVVPGPVGLAFQRAVYTKEDLPWRPAIEGSGWRLAALQNQWVRGRSLAMLTALEQTTDRDDQLALQVIRPKEAWFEISPTTATSARVVQEWNFQSGYPAPTWNCSAPRWPTFPVSPAPIAPALKVWWNPDRETAPFAVLIQGADFKTPREIVARKVFSETEAVVVDSVRVEEHLVETAPGKKEIRSCLVVRVNHPVGSPIRTRIRGISTLGEEHRDYQSAGQYAGLFWPVTVDQADELLIAVELISVAEFKRTAQRRKFMLSLDGLPAPDPSDVRPTSPAPAQ